MRERDVQKAIMDYLAAERIPAWRMNTGAVSASYNGKKRFFRFGQKGMADILAMPTKTISFNPGDPCADFSFPIALWIEVKNEDGKLTVEQQDFCAYVRANGMGYMMARSIEDVKFWLENCR